MSPSFTGWLILLVFVGADFESVTIGSLHWDVFILIIGSIISIGLYFVTDDVHKPSKLLQHVFATQTFFAAICWLNLLCSETVALLQSIGLMWGVSSSVLGLTVLAMGNCVADFISNCVVAKKLGPGTPVAACFGSPLLSYLLGLGIALLVVLLDQYPEELVLDIKSSTQVSSTCLIPVYIVLTPYTYLSSLFVCFSHI